MIKCVYMFIFFPALAVYTRSPAAYEALKGFNILKFPSVSSIKAFTGSNLERPGDIQKRLSESYKQYQAMVEQKKSEGMKPPLGEGVLIFDEVKVAMKVSWNSRNEELVGLAMTSVEMQTLQDVYDTLSSDSKTQKTTYALQTLWRDLTSEYDIIGPYYTSASTMKSKFLLPCIVDAIYQFHVFNFETSLLICDGASANLTLLKALCGKNGAYAHNDKQSDKFEVPVSFTNPFTGQPIYQLICPSHQVSVCCVCLCVNPFILYM